MPYRIWITVSFLTPLFFRYHLPLKITKENKTVEYCWAIEKNEMSWNER